MLVKFVIKNQLGSAFPTEQMILRTKACKSVFKVPIIKIASKGVDNTGYVDQIKHRCQFKFFFYYVTAKNTTAKSTHTHNFQSYCYNKKLNIHIHSDINDTLQQQTCMQLLGTQTFCSFFIHD